MLIANPYLADFCSKHRRASTRNRKQLSFERIVRILVGNPEDVVDGHAVVHSFSRGRSPGSWPSQSEKGISEDVRILSDGFILRRPWGWSRRRPLERLRSASHNSGDEADAEEGAAFFHRNLQMTAVMPSKTEPRNTNRSF